MKHLTKKIIFIFILLSINITLFAAIKTADGYYWDYSYTTPTSYELSSIEVQNLYSINNGSTTAGMSNYQGFYMGQFTVDFSKNSAIISDEYYELFEDSTKQLLLNLDHLMYYTKHGYIYNDRIYVSDASGNGSTISGFVKVTKTDEDGSSKEIKWYDITDSSNFYLNNDNYFGEITTQIFTFDYYFVINDIQYLDPYVDWTLNIPALSQTEYVMPTVRIKILDTDVTWESDGINSGDTIDANINTCLNTEFYVLNPAYTSSGNFLTDNSQQTSDIYNLNIDITKKFDESTDNFFDGDMHDYYALDFDSYKYSEKIEEPFTLALEITSANNWNLYLDNEETTNSNEIIPYNLYLKYKGSSSYKTELVNSIVGKIILKNIVSSNASSIIYLTTQSNSANSSNNTKGMYYDTIYINFITDGWLNSNEDNFAQKIITLGD